MGRTMAVVLFTDLVGSTELRGRLGEEAADELRRTHDRLLTEAVERRGGRVVKGLGDGVMATFTGASDAVAAAAAIQQAIDRLNRSGKAPVPLAVRVGLSAGDVADDGEDVHGTPVIEASRLCGAAGGGEIMAAAVVRILAGSTVGHDFVSVGALGLKGLDHPVEAVRVGWEPAAVSTIPMPALLTDIGRIFVGRDDELERLQQLWKEATAGERRVAFLAGEPGVGKTRLAAELAIRVHEEGAVVLAGRCDEDLGVPYQPFVEALRHYVDHTPTGDIHQRLGRYRGELVRLLPDVAELISDLPPPLQSDPETERYRLFDAVAAWLAAVAAEDPVLLVLDDVHWAAKPTLLLLRHVVRAAGLNRLLVIGAYRDTEVSRDNPLSEVLADLRRQREVERLSMRGLDSPSVTAYMEQAAGHALDRDDVDLAQAIHDETEGNPFFVREVFRHLTETGFIERRGGRWTTRLPVADVGIPESVRDVVGRRLSRLSERANRVLRVASVIGAEFDLPIVSTAAGLDEDSVLSAMEEAGGARLVLEASGVVNRYRFAHALVRDTLYEELSASRRVSLHRQVAEALEAVHAATLDDHLAALAHHWSRASAPAADTTRAVDYATRAGDKALRQLAHDEAVTYYREALELREVAGSGPDRQHCTLMISLGEAQRRAGDPAHRETLLRAGRLARQLNDTELLARAALANQRVLFSRLGAVDADRVQAFEVALEAVGPRDSPERARLLAALASELHFAGEERRKVELGREGLAIARRLGDTFTLADAIVALWFAVLDPTTVSERSHLADELVAISERIGDPSLEFHAGFIKFFTGSEQGDMAVADSGLATCMRVADEVGLPVLRWRAAILQCHRAYIDGRLDDIERWSKEGERLGEEAGQPDASAFSDVFVVRILQGRPGEAVELARPLVETYRDSPVYRSGLAWACAEAGQLVEARSLLAEVRGAGFADLPRDYLWLLTLVVLGRTSARLAAASEAAELYELLRPHHSAIALGQSTWLGPVAYDLGLLATTLGRYADADAHFAEAVETNIRMRLRGMLAQSYLEWSRMLLTRREPGDAERARELLGHAVVTARELGLANIERQAGSFLGDCA